MYKQGDILKREDIPEDECKVCALHEKAREFFEKKNEHYSLENTPDLCPSCNSVLYPICTHKHSHTVVGGHNVYTEDENIGYYRLFECCDCNKMFALMPTEIIYNGNHDIYYTGGKAFLSPTDEEFILKEAQAELVENAKQWAKRVQAGENLSPSHLALWNERVLSGAISEFLYFKGLKK